jgi:hypothetical protein
MEKMFTNWINNLFGLSDKIFGLMEKTAANADIDVKSKDSRLVALSGMQESVLSCGFWLNTYCSIAENHKDESMILKYAGSNLSLEKTADIMLKNIRLGLVIFFHFNLENLLGNLLNKISNKKLQGLGKIFTELSNEVGLRDISKKANIIKAFSSIRNSLHNNGVHNDASFSVKVKGLDYEFIKGGVVQCASLNHSINLIQAITDIINETLETEKIKGIKEIIPDTFSEWLDKKNS